MLRKSGQEGDDTVNHKAPLQKEQVELRTLIGICCFGRCDRLLLELWCNHNLHVLGYTNSLWRVSRLSSRSASLGSCGARKPAATSRDDSRESKGQEAAPDQEMESHEVAILQDR